jgi:two-component system phosphate regulon sensor histidine kinase PhoR
MPAQSTADGSLRAVMEACADGIVVVDAEGDVRYVNAAAARLLHASPSAVAQGSSLALLRDHIAHRALLECLADGSPRSATITSSRAGHILDISMVPLRDAGDWSVALYLRDVTEVRRLETVRRDFVANISHELRTPLASIKAVVEALQGGALEEEDLAQEFLGGINDEVDRLSLLVEELMELARIESGQVPFRFEPIDAQEILHDSVRRLEPQAMRASVSLTVEEGEPGVVSADRDRLERALVNLIHNAIKFTPSGGSVTVSGVAAHGWVELRVRDTGVGISPEQLGRIFERFYKVDKARGNPGTGLGLAIVKHVAEAHGGSVSVKSTQGEGSTFAIRLPAATDAC